MSKSGTKFEPLFYFQSSLCICPREQVRSQSSHRWLQRLQRGLIVLRLKWQRNEVILPSLGTVMVRDGQGWQRVGGADFLVTLRISFRIQNCLKFVPSIVLFPSCFSSVHLIAIILKSDLRMQIIAQTAGHKKAVRLSVNWIELKAVCFQMKHYNFL